MWTWLLQVYNNPLVSQGAMGSATDAEFDVLLLRA
jgi:hypothetical protein